MASIYMRIDGFTSDGSATVKEIKTKNGKNKGWFALNSFTWSGSRKVAMDVGNMTNADSGKVAFSKVRVSKEVDGASEDLLSFLFAPGEKGKTVEIAFTKPSRLGKGKEVYFQLKLEEARLVNYSVYGVKGSQPLERMSLSYTVIHQKHSYEASGGDLKDGGLVTFDLKEGEMKSGSKK
ncbi:Hcp family type VI secretion system effector [Vibrio pectenicida]|uniref:Type VI secretion system tube protein Hcp n=1 Tax=Vibrio pectenicida TaxID=62763 RepID=A0A3R9FQL4_9VIBR|nr:type VI secretion system tube protein Hcp [Vibrio pectenicida]RSD32062.1 type VI secretion system tube protein Hcp [Vibrio pectenicida]